MAELSPAAQAVLDAALGEAGPAFELLARVMAAAALRAVADQVAPEGQSEPHGSGFRWGAWASKKGIREKITAIATELENIND